MHVGLQKENPKNIEHALPELTTSAIKTTLVCETEVEINNGLKLKSLNIDKLCEKSVLVHPV